MLFKPQFTFEKVRFDQTTDLFLVLSITAPKSDLQTSRPSLCIVPAVDRSGSMSGPKMEYTKRSLHKMVDHLTENDRFGLVSFSDDATIDFPPERMTVEAKVRVRRVINAYRPSNSTNISGGITKAIEAIGSQDVGESTICRVILFTDGQPNVGIVDATALCSLVETRRGRISISAFGYGSDANQSLLGAMADKGAGNYYPVFIEENPEGQVRCDGR